MAIPLKDGRALVKVNRTTRAILEGTEDLKSWTEAELERGARRGRDGKFRKPPTLVAKAVHDELVRRKMTKAYDLLKKSTHKAVKVLVEIATDRTADPAVRAKCATEILNRTLGMPKTEMKLDVQGMEPWMQMVASSIVSSADDLVEGEVVDER